jgi:recombination protein RecR
VCGALDTADPCAICGNAERDGALICVVEEVGSLWAMERAGAFRGRYHVLGGLLSALDGVGPEALRIDSLVRRAADPVVKEVVLALPATVDGQTTAHYLTDRLAGAGVEVTMLARGVPVGGDLDWLDDGTIAQALRARRPA